MDFDKDRIVTEASHPAQVFKAGLSELPYDDLVCMDFLLSNLRHEHSLQYKDCRAALSNEGVEVYKKALLMAKVDTPKLKHYYPSHIRFKRNIIKWYQRIVSAALSYAEEDRCADLDYDAILVKLKPVK